MKCDSAMQKFLELDNGASIPFLVRLHTLRCRKCRLEIREMRIRLAVFEYHPPYEAKRDASDEIMRTIIANEKLYSSGMSFKKWIAVGLVILLSRFAITFSDTLAWLQNQFGSSLDIPLNIVLGLAMSIYAVLFIGTHMDDIKKMIPDRFR